MKLTYDPRYNIAYIRLHEKKAEVETIRVSDELNVDIAPDGTCIRHRVAERQRAIARRRRGELCRRQRSARRAPGNSVGEVIVRADS